MKKKFKVGEFVRIVNPRCPYEIEDFYIKGKGKIAKIIEDNREGCKYKVKFIENLGKVCSVYDEDELETATEKDAFLEWL